MRYHHLVDTIVSGLGTVAAVVAAYWWLRASLVKVPDSMDSFIAALQKASRLNAHGAAAAVVAALCAAYLFSRQLGVWPDQI